MAGTMMVRPRISSVEIVEIGVQLIEEP